MVRREEGRRSATTALAIMLLGLALLAGCDDGESDEKPEATGCTPATVATDCAEGEYCYLAEGATVGSCAFGCRLDPDSCPTGQHCDESHRCVEDQTTCSPEDCADGEYCDADGTGECRPGCADDSACNTDACERCVDHACESAVVCATDADCAGATDSGLYWCDTTTACGACQEAECLGPEDCRDPSFPVCSEHECIPCLGCPKECDDDSDDPRLHCPSSFYCNESSFCAPTCEDDAGCWESHGEDHVCCTDPDLCEHQACQHRCEEDGIWQCPEGQYCDRGHCAVGCADDSECAPCNVCDPESHDCRAGCRDDSCCDAGQFCNLAAAACEAGCREDIECVDEGEHFACITHRCQPRPCPQGDEDCPAGTYCSGETNACAPGCRNSLDCDPEQACEPTSHTCIARCDGDDSCPEGEVCTDAAGLCEPGCRADRLEPNDTRDAAVELDLQDDERSEAGLRVCSGDVDWLFVTLVEQELTVSATFDPASGGLELALLSEAGEVLAEAPAADGEREAVLAGPYSGAVLVRITGTEPLPVAGLSYDLLAVARDRSCAADWAEGDGGNDGWETAHVLGSGQHTELGLCPAVPSAEPPVPADEDWYAFELLTGDGVVARLYFDDEATPLRMTLYGPGSPEPVQVSEAGRVDDEPTRLLEVAEVVQDGTYYLRIVSSAPTDAAVGYGLDLELDSAAPCSADRLEPNDLRAEATPLPTPLYDHQEQDLRVCAGDEDWFQIDLLDGDILRIEVQHDAAQGNLDLELYRGGAVVQTAATAQDAERLYVLVEGELSADSYFLRVFSPELDEAAYTLTAQVELPPDACYDDFYEPNDSQDAAEPIACGQRLEGLFTCLDDDDYFEVTTFHYGALDARVEHLVPAGELGVEIFDADGEGVDTTDGGELDGSEAKVARTAGVPEGTYYVWVYSQGLPNRYSLELDCTELDPSCQGDVLEPNDQRDIARPLVLPRVAGSLPFEELLWEDLTLCDADDHDWYQFLAKAGDDLHIEIRFFHFRAGDLDMELYCGAGDAPVAVSDSGDDDELVHYLVPADGVCWLHVHGVPLEDSGASYELAIRDYESCLGDDDCPDDMVCDLAVLGCRLPQ